MKTPRITAIFLALVVGATFLYASGASAASFTVKAARSSGEWVWQPRKKAIVRGDRIVWKNPTQVEHDITATSSNWNKETFLPTGAQTSKRFWQTGTYKYMCTLHAARANGRCFGMCGTIVVRRPS